MHRRVSGPARRHEKGPARRRLQRRMLSLAAGMLLALPATHAGPPAAEPGAALSWRQWRGVLFRVVAPAPATPSRDRPVSFLLGTLHFGSVEELHLDAELLQNAMRHTRLFIGEVPMSAPRSAQLDGHRRLPAQRNLRDLLGQAPFDALQRLLPQLPAAQLLHAKPWLALALLESRGETVSEQTLDRQLAQWAAREGLPAFHLETLAAQLQALDCVPAEEHAQVLRQRLAMPWLFEEQAQRVLEYYRAGDLPAWLDEIDAMTGLDAQARPIEQRARLCLIEARNALWMDQLDPLLRAGSAFVAVGAIHLTGEAGLLASLHQRGFSIVAEPLPLQ
ncbi:TraB/GumN family protein [Corticibacter populi]|nr:TraB/GumN family protein [Corticibacter populi]